MATQLHPIAVEDDVSNAIDNVSHLPITTARLPAAYNAAVAALTNCASIDECQSWANKAQALASYARQSNDDTLQKQAIRIQSRAIRRCGELLKEFDGRGGDHTKSGGTPTLAPSRREVAEDAGMSKDQQVTAVRVANVPVQAFEQAVESETPPTITKLADWGRKPSAKPEWFQEMEKAKPKPGWRSFVRLSGLARQMAELCRDSEPIIVADAVEQHERRELRSNIAQVRRWLKQIAPHLRSSTDGL